MTGIVDYNAGNIKSVEHALEVLKAPYILSSNPKDLEKCSKIIFPGVGDAAYAMKELKKTGFDIFLKEWALSGKPLAGICLGSQIIFDYSEEGDTQCLGLLKGKIISLKNLWSKLHPDKEEHRQRAMLYNELKSPHMGWNSLSFINGSSKYLEGIPEESDFYFVHSYVIQAEDPVIIKAYTHYGAMIPSVVEKDNITAFQFHPEKSGKYGLEILRNFTGKGKENNA